MSPEAKQAFRETWGVEAPKVYYFGIGVALIWATLGATGVIRGIAAGVVLGLFTLLGSYLFRTRWSGRPMILITTEAAKTIQDGRYALKTPPKEQLH